MRRFQFVGQKNPGSMGLRSIIVLLMTGFVVVLFCACSSSLSNSYTVTKSGTDYVVDKESSTISDGTNTYQYTFLVILPHML